MTATVENSTAPQAPRTARATGYCRLGLGPIVTGEYGGTPAALTIPIEQVVAADVRTRPNGAPLRVTVRGGDRVASPAMDAAEAFAARTGLTGDVRITLRLPFAAAGVGVAEATAAAVLDALAKAEEVSLTPAQRATIVADLGRPAQGLAYGTPVLVDRQGRALRTLEEPGRLFLIVAYPKDRKAIAGDVGQLPASPEDVTSPRALAEWLVACAGAGASTVAHILSALANEAAPTLGVIGGHDEMSPVALLIPGGYEHLSTATHLCNAANAALNSLDGTGHWAVAVLRTAAPSAAA